MVFTKRISLMWGVAAVSAIAGYVGIERSLVRRDPVREWLPRVNWSSKDFEVVGGRALGWRALAADLLWVRTIQYLGDPVQAREKYPKFLPLVRSVVEADPHCVAAYSSGSAVLMWVVKDPAAAIELLKEGIRNNPTYGRFQLYLAAFTYYQADHVEQTIGLLETLVEDEDHPVMLEPILGNLYVKIRQWEKARQLWWWMWYHSRSEDNRRYAKDHLERHGYWHP